MELTGTIIQVCPLESGTTKAGKAFQKLTFVMQYEENSQYPKSVAITLLNKHVEDNAQLVVPNTRVNVKFDISSREYNGRWYTEAMGWRVEQPAQAAQPVAPQYAAPAPQAPQGWQQPMSQMYGQPAPAPAPMPQVPDNDGLPF